MAEQTKKLPACPVCGSECISIRDGLGRRFSGQKNMIVACTSSRCQYSVGSDVAHNTLCADIERGRKYDAMEGDKKLAWLALAELDKLLGMAVRLLDQWRTDFPVLYVGNLTPRPLDDQTDALLDTPAVAAILKQQKDGGKG